MTQGKDITGLKFGSLTALEPTDERKEGKVVWKCRCDCGNITYVSRKYLRNGKIQSCGCQRIGPIDVTGQRFGRLTAIKPTGERRGTSLVWLCKCDCGNETKVPLQYLRSGRTKSCGCLQRDYYARNRKKVVDAEETKEVPADQ